MLLKRERPGTTTLAWSGPDRSLPSGLACVPLGAGADTAIAAKLRGGAWDAVLWHVPEHDPWREPRLGFRNPRAWRAWRLLRALRSTPRVPLVVLDTRDEPAPTHGALAMLERARTYFLRELAAGVPPLVRAADPRLAEKLEPVSIGLGRDRVAEMPGLPADKTVDVFFAGQADTPLRRAELPALRALARTGVRVEAADRRMPRPEYYQRCASAWLVWSPEGRGWQCFRHLEAAACGAVPLMNRPTIRQHEPLVEGVHGLYYEPGPRGLADAILAALADKPRLARIAEAGRRHVLEHHTHATICDRILAEIET